MKQDGLHLVSQDVKQRAQFLRADKFEERLLSCTRAVLVLIKFSAVVESNLC
jgi:hypothetical protein